MVQNICFIRQYWRI